MISSRVKDAFAKLNEKSSYAIGLEHALANVVAAAEKIEQTPPHTPTEKLMQKCAWEALIALVR